MELRLWCSNRGSLWVPEPRSRWVRGIPHYRHKPWVLRQRTEPPASTWKEQQPPQGRNGVCLGAGAGGSGNSCDSSPKVQLQERFNHATGSSFPLWTLTRHWLRGPGWSPSPVTLSRAASWLEQQPTARGRNCQGETARGGAKGGAGQGRRGRGNCGGASWPYASPRPQCPPCLMQAMQLSLINRPFLRTPEQWALGAPFRESLTTRV